VIEARGLDLTFQTADGPVQALRDVNLTIDKGDFVSFIGPRAAARPPSCGSSRRWSIPRAARSPSTA
jgi:energy-coupling factor transporter ATP-binding protein EcfA2